MATPTALTFQAYGYMGTGSATDSLELFSKADVASTGFQRVSIAKEFAASATDQTLDLSVFVDTATYIAIEDRNNTGVLVGRTAGTAARLNIAANGFLMFKNGAATPPTLYFDNVSTTDKAFITVYVLGTSA